MRGRLSILVIAAALAVGLWYFFAPSDTPDVTQSDTDEPVSGAAPAVDDPETADTSTEPAADTAQTKEADADSTADRAQVADSDTDVTTDAAQATEPGTTIQAGDTQTADSGADSTTDVTQTPESGATPPAGDTQTAGSGADSATDVAQTPESGATPPAGDTQTADSGADSATDVAQTPESGATPPAGDTQTADSGADSATDIAQTSEPDATVASDVAQTAGTGLVPPVDASGTPGPGTDETGPQAAAEKVVLAPATEGTIERTPIAPADATPEDETDRPDVLAAVTDGIDRLKTAIQDQLGIEPEEDTDTTLHLRIEYDDTPQDPAPAGLVPDEGPETAAVDAAPPADVAQTPESGATPPAGDTQTAGSGADSATDIAQTSEPDATVASDVAQTAGTGLVPEEGPETVAVDTVPPADVAQTTDTEVASDVAQTVGTGLVPPVDAAGTPGSGTVGTGPQDAAMEADPSDKRKVVLAPAAEGTIERTPIAPVDATPEDETDRPDVLAAVADGIDRLKTAIESQLGIEPGEDTDTPLRLRIEYDDTKQDPAPTGLEPDEGSETAADDAAPPPDVAPTTDTDTELAAGDAAPAPDLAQTTDTGTEPPTGSAQAIGSDGTPSTNQLRTADSGTTPPPSIDPTARADATGDETAGAEAKQYVETLTATTPPTIAVDKADHFVTQDSVVSLVPEDSIESTTVGDLADDETLRPETPITVVREVEQIETAVPEQLIADSGGDLDTLLRVVVKYDDSQQIDEQSGADEDVAEQRETTRNVVTEDTSEQKATAQNVAAEDTSEQKATAQNVAAEDTSEQSGVEQITVREALERMRTEPEKPLMIIKTVRYFEVMTLRELLDSEEDTDAFLNVVLQPYRIEAATLADLLRLHKTDSPDTISYLHTVQPTDEQGIWGIVQFGLIENFARGMAVRHGEEFETYTVQIPRHADERRDDQSSSFLGRFIDRKTKESYVYNFRENRMGRNPDTIFPGQEIVIINFEPGELEAIFEHFARG